MWGLQGKIDVSVQATLVDNGPKSWASSTSKSKTERGEGKKGESWTMPFEIKTGRSQGIMEHRAQTMLYTLLMEDRYGVSSLSLPAVPLPPLLI
jgi:DNA replication ATP-dependent helicase Dna2